MRLLRYIPDDTKFGFMQYRRISFPLSAVLSVLTIVLFFAVGMNFGIDFRGGTLIEMQARNGVADLASIRQTASGLGFGDVEVQTFGGPDEVLMRFGLQGDSEQAQQAVVGAVRGAFEADYDFRRVEVVGPRVSGELVQSGTLGVVVAVLAVLIYLWFRFEWQFAVGAVIATLHDLVLTIGFFSITQLEFNMTSIAAILTIVGYSLNDTVVVYDRIREMLRKYKRLSLPDIIDIAINSTLSRTIMTATTTFLALMALAIFGGAVIQSFSLAMIFGVVMGTYSSIFIAAPVLIYLGAKVGGEGEAGEKTQASAQQAAP
ncbi:MULTISPECIES: protein translocase subunit SecF [Chelatococcus]|uniref:Protein-export membrane protein SecF n=1 Tax=Chelatococcus caeni TaxID=1348468 RepID=A0A840BVC8_9HYPH|nr:MULTISPECIES: protein translocase subunit SecF [Chelatococcus]ALA19221.1 preprotein translocase subunit SecF [Chelatococcus sp. CO-6]MBB4016523.1 preprotein translocase subunit SecF [Chelatococcus caeni]